MAAMDAVEKEAQKSTRKRVHFTDLPEEDDESSARMEKKVRFPKGKKDKEGKKDKDNARMGLQDMEEDEVGDGPIKATDPRLAAKERATRRQFAEAQKTLEEEDMGPAEEEFEGTLEEEADFEPFNLKKEREEGYFDPEGNYVEYKLQGEIRDAWLDSVEVDTRYAERAAALGDDEDEQQEPESELSSAELAAIKRRIADALLPQETVLSALRRLGGNSSTKVKGNTGYRKGKGKDKDKDSAAEEEKRTAPVASGKERMPEGNKALFDKLTEDSVKLMDHGEYNVYSDKKETFLREAEGYEALQRAREQMLTSQVAAGDEDDDMFGDGGGRPAAADRTAGGAGQAPAEGKSNSGPAGQSSEGAASGDGGKDEGAAASTVTAGGAMDEESGYVLDPTTGYYYNSMLGYYYDSSTGLFCSAATGLWYKFDEASGAYTEVVQDANASSTGDVSASEAPKGGNEIVEK